MNFNINFSEIQSYLSRVNCWPEIKISHERKSDFTESEANIRYLKFRRGTSVIKFTYCVAKEGHCAYIKNIGIWLDFVS